MKILFVRPRPSKKTIGLQHVMIVEPLELEVLSALCRAHDNPVLIDLIIEKKPLEYFLKKYHPDVVCITGYITNVSSIKKYCYIIKKHSAEIKTVVGGVHCEVCPEDFNDSNIDFRAVRNAAVNFTALLKHIEFGDKLPEGILLPGMICSRSSLPEYDFKVPFPDRKISARYRHKYFYIFHNKVALIKTSFGCPYSCNFCFCHIITQGKFKNRAISEVVQELESINEKEIYIVDDDFLNDRKRLLSFVDLIRKRGIRKKYLVYGRADFIAKNPDVIAELKSVGLRTVIIGFESFDQEELDMYNKKSSVQNNVKAMDILRSNKIDCFATIIIHPDWGKKDFQTMIRTVKSLGIHYVNLQPLTPLPGTGVKFPADRMLIGPKEFEKWDLAHVSVKPEKLSTRQFYREIMIAYMKILYQPKVLLKYLVSYSPAMLWKMLYGSFMVQKQYKMKIKIG